MSGANFLVDTNFLIYLLNGKHFVKPYLNNNFFVSEITEMELLGVRGIPLSILKTRSALIENCFIVNFNSDIKKIAIQIKQQISIKLPDAIIAATAMYMGMPLVTADRGYISVTGLEVNFLKL
ncbi:MAG: type II toxin-antitoxin system VapC family toxin [Bacteroidetes bacterium]|nr:type II toxin-antitoxin system VapC family toxin [Bacteroidota bacterium]MBS1539169.1 type II toxin-antitoxin system VapC family toxin [Bacteroidota bacterium]